MKKLLVGNAPCSWGSLEFAGTKTSEQIQYGRMLDELAESGYTGTELGDWGYMPTDPAVLSDELKRRGLVMLGAFVPIALKYSTEHAAGIANAVKTARLLAAVAGTPPPFVVLADANGTDPQRTGAAGRVTADMGLSPAEWKTFARGAELVARAVLEQTGLKTVFHHHCAGYIETPEDIRILLDLTDEALLGLVFDTGHYCFGSGATPSDMLSFLDSIAARVSYVHLKDCQPEIARLARAGRWDYFSALRHGVFCELGDGYVDFPALLRWLASQGYDRYVLVEQDILPGMGAPKESAQKSRQYLRSIESNFA